MKLSSVSSAESLANFTVFLSASLPDHLRGSSRYQDLSDFLVTLVGGIWARQGALVFGGHPTITPLLHRVCVNRGVRSRPGLQVFQHRKFRSSAPPEVRDRSVFQEPNWWGTPSPLSDEFEREMREMRRAMIDNSKAAIFVGGRLKEGDQTQQGVRQEFQFFLEKRKGPAYLVGFLDGVAAQLAEELRRAGCREPNGLRAEELDVVHRSENVDFVADVILSDLERHATSQKRRDSPAEGGEA